MPEETPEKPPHPSSSDSEPTADTEARRWSQIQDLFHQTLEQEPSERATFLQNACSDNSLRAEVQGLLAASEGAETHLGGVIRRTLELVQGDSSVPIGERMIGPYRLMKELGRGGMGTVYLAERDDEHFHKRVAIKLVRPGMDTAEILQRLRQERQILAHLEHPNIAKLHDGGNTEDGVPYFVMEYIDGEPIDVYCKRLQLGVVDRLHLFCAVCSAVQHAHRNLVIHRDLKPSNILVTADGTPKLLDFGIAKLMSPSVADSQPAPTAAWMRLLTPEYASPEQLLGQTLTTSSDVYSLGVLLFELLVGCSPYKVDRKQQAALEKAVCELAPERPSLAATAHRSPKWQRLLRGDLDNIVLTTLRKNPLRRYASVEQLSGDIERHLRGMPISARPDTFGYRAHKFFQRHRTSLLSGSVGVLIIIALISFYTTQLADQRDRALREERKATQVADYLRSLFEQVDPSRSLGEHITARQLLDQGARRIELELAEEPEIQSDLMDLMATVYQSLGLYEEADPLLQESAEVRRRLYDSEHETVGASLHHRALWLHATGQYELSEKVFRQALEIRRDLLGPEHPAVAASLSGLADLLYDSGSPAAAEELFRQALVIHQTFFGDRSSEVATSLNNLGVTAYALGKLDQAELLLLEALKLRQDLLGEQHPDIAVTLSALAAVYLAQKKPQPATTLFMQALQMRRSIYGDRHPMIAISLNNLGELKRRQQDYVAAERLLREAIQIFQDLNISQHPRHANSLENLAWTLDLSGQYSAAEPFHRQALALTQEQLGPEHRNVSWILRNLGDSLVAQDRLEEAAEVFQQALDAGRRSIPVNERRLVSLMVRSADVQLALGAPAKADTILQEALPLLSKTDSSPSRRANVLHLRGKALAALGNTIEAREHFEQGLVSLQSASREESALAAQISHELETLSGLDSQPSSSSSSSSQ